jgi:hypothetical protein
LAKQEEDSPLKDEMPFHNRYKVQQCSLAQNAHYFHIENIEFYQSPFGQNPDAQQPEYQKRVSPACTAN